jgi:hypothetical protein
MPKIVAATASVVIPCLLIPLIVFSLSPTESGLLVSLIQGVFAFVRAIRMA